MKILKCPKCGRSGGGLHFKSARPGTRLYPYVKHYKQRPFCNIPSSILLQIEFLDPKLNAWKTVLDTTEWHKISSLASRYSSTDLYLNRTDVQKIRDELLDIIDREMHWRKKIAATKKRPKAFTLHGHIIRMPKIPSTVVDLEGLRVRTEKLCQKNNDLNLLSVYLYIVLAILHASMTRESVIQLVPLYEITRRQITGKQKLRILKRHEREVLPIFDPKTRDEALECGFYGVQCTNTTCRSWRTDLVLAGRGSKCMCHACGTTGLDAGVRQDCPHCHRPFYDNVIRGMIKMAVDSDGDKILTRCIYCKEEVHFPKKHIEAFSDALLV